MSEEVSLATADTIADLRARLAEREAELASAHEQLAIAESTIALWRDAGALLHGSRDERGAARVAMKRLLRDPEAGAGELRRLRQELRETQTQVIDSDRRAADARNDRNIMRQALDEIGTHTVGTVTTYMNDDGNADAEPCEACGDMREIASQALALVKTGRR